MLSVWSGVPLSCETGWAVTEFTIQTHTTHGSTEIQKLIYIFVLLVGEIAVESSVCGWLVTGGLPAQILWPFWKNVGMESE